MKARSLTRLFAAVIIIAIADSSVLAQDKQASSQKERKEMTAVRVPDASIDINGRLDDAAWEQALFVTDFLQVIPVEFGEPTNSTEVAIVYDDEAVYIGARMYVDDPENLRMDLSRRDDRGLGEQIIITLDTYCDRRTSYGFGVTTAGVRFDRYSSDDTQHSDFSWDAVWEVRTSVVDKSWIAEFKIPFSQLRFNNTDVQTWGININRWIPYTTEDIFWVPVLPSETGWASRFGNLVGIEGIQPSRRLELMPYAASDGQFTNNYAPGDPYDDGSELGGRLGGDLKMGLGPNLTLDATFNPDFGQVEADPAVVNLSAYETNFEEKRPFFTEGSDLFSTIGPRWFYSRRIGARPHGEAGGDFVDYPSNTTILGAAKVTGRLQSGTSIGGLLAVTDSEKANVNNLYRQDTTYNEDSTSYDVDTSFAESHSTRVEPRTVHGVIRVKQDIGEGGSTAGLILTGLARNMDDTDPLAGLLTKEAFSGGIDWHLQFRDRTYSLLGHAGFSRIKGSKEAILVRQLSSAHYFQRPDADHVEVDSARTSLTGSTFGLGFEKNGGEHWLWEIGTVVESPGLDLNDAGILNTADDIDSWADLTYRETRPGKYFRNYRIELEGYSGWNFDKVRQESGLELAFNGQWLNYWMTEASYSYHFGGLDDAMTRGGPLAGSPDSWTVAGFVSNNFNAVTNYNINGWYAHNDLGGYGWRVGGQLSSRIGDRIKLSVSPSYQVTDSKRQYIDTTFNNSSGQTDYVFSNLKQSELSMQLRGSYFFNPNLSLELYAQPFASSGHYYNYGTLREPGSKYLDSQDPSDETDSYDQFPTDDDYGGRSFRSSMVLRWEFSPGSTAYFVWQRNMTDNINPGRQVRAGSLLDGFSGDGIDMLAIKISYWIPIS